MNTKEQVLADYMAGVQSGDRGRLRQLSSPEFAPGEITEAIDRTLTTIGRRPWTNPTMKWSEGITPSMASAVIAATDDHGKSITDTVYMVLLGDTWFVALGGEE